MTGSYLWLRLNHFEERTTYHLDQGLHLLESYQMVEDKKIRLIGPMVSSKTFMERGFFIGPQYYYILAGLGLLTRWNPMAVNLILLLIELGFILYFVWWIGKKYGWTEAFGVFGLLTFSKYFIIHSRFFWNPHFLLPLGIAAVIFLDKYIQKNKGKYLLMVGFLWGLAFSFHYSAVFWSIPLVLILVKNKKLFDKRIFLLPIGFILGDLPWFVFEIKHNFYNIKTMLVVMTKSTDRGEMESHYFTYPMVVFLLWLVIFFLKKIKTIKIKWLVIGTLTIFVCLWQLILFKGNDPLGHPKNWNYIMIKRATEEILKNGCPKNFNIASTVSGDTRSYDLRFLLLSKGCRAMGVEEYPKSKRLFLVAPKERPPENESVWEVSVLKKFEIKEKILLGDDIYLYQLEKTY